MIDDDPDPGTDPLAGRDPHPRTQIDLWPLHDARQELLEEIVSQPGAGNTAPSARRVLIPAGIAAAIALVIGVAWGAVSSDDDSGNDDQVVASSESAESSDRASDPATEPSDVSSESAEPTQPETTPIGELRRGDTLTPQQCRAFRHPHADRANQLTVETSLKELAYVARLVPRNGKVRWIKAFRGKGNRFIAIDEDCTVVSAGKGVLRLR